MEHLRSTKLVIVLLIFFSILGACTFGFTESNDTKAAIPTPLQGKSNLYGRVLTSSGDAISDFPVRLAQVYYNELGEGAFALDESTSPAALTDKEGYYLVKDVAPSDYVLFIGSVNSDYMILLDEKGAPKVLKLSESQLLTLDDIKVSFK